MKGLLRQALLYLPWERQEEPDCSFVWSSCEKTWSPVRGPGGGGGPGLPEGECE